MLSEDEKRALRQKQRLLYSSGQFPLGGNQSGGTRRGRRPMNPLKALAVGVVVVLMVIVGLVVLLTKSVRAAPAEARDRSEIGVAAPVAHEHDGEREHAEQRRAK